MTTVYKGNSGISGNSGIIASATHEPGLVRVIKESDKRHRKYAVVCPHAGKAFCWTDFVKSLKQLPLDQAHVVLYDNSCSDRHQKKMLKLAKELPSVTVIEDRNKPSTIENTIVAHRLIDRCCYVYEEIYDRHLPKSDFVLNLEDDIGIPPGGFNQLEWVLGDENVGTVISDCVDRRMMVGEGKKQSIVVNFHERNQIGGHDERYVDLEMVQPRAGGVEYVGSGHMGLWLTRREAIDATGMKTDMQARELGQDIQYGMRLHEAGWRFAVNWGVKAKHFYVDKETGRKASV